jgi:hypothetical protein
MKKPLIFYTPFSKETEPNLKCLMFRMLEPWGYLIDGVIGILTFTLIQTTFGVDCITYRMLERCKERTLK